MSTTLHVISIRYYFYHYVKFFLHFLVCSLMRPRLSQGLEALITLEWFIWSTKSSLKCWQCQWGHVIQFLVSRCSQAFCVRFVPFFHQSKFFTYCHWYCHGIHVIISVVMIIASYFVCWDKLVAMLIARPMGLNFSWKVTSASLSPIWTKRCGPLQTQNSSRLLCSLLWAKPFDWQISTATLVFNTLMELKWRSCPFICLAKHSGM